MSDAADLLGALVLEDGTLWATRAEDFQRADAAAVLTDDGPRWHWWLRARGMSKTSDAAALGLALLVAEAPPRSRSYAYAVDERQAALLLDALVGFAERSGLLGALDVGTRSVTVRATGARLSVEASDSASAFGTRPWLVLGEEVALWPETANHRRLWASIISSLGKVPGSRLLVMSTAGAPGSTPHKRWLAAVEADHWRTSLTPGPSPWWRLEDVEAARRDLLPAEFARYVLCEWTEAEDSLATAEDVAACAGDYTALEPLRGLTYVMGLDIGTRRDATALVVGHLEASPGGRLVVVDRVLRWTGTRLRPVSLTDVEEAVIGMSRRYNRARLIVDPYQAAQLTERLKKARLSVTDFTFSTSGVNRLARTLFGALRDRAIILPDDRVLLDELAGVRLVETGPGLVRLDHRSSEHDDQAVAVAMVAASLLDRPSGDLRFVPPPPLRLPRTRPSYSTAPRPETTVVRDRKGDRRFVRPGEHFAADARRAPGYTPPGRTRR